eukprot:s1615_g8.t1
MGGSLLRDPGFGIQQRLRSAECPLEFPTLSTTLSTTGAREKALVRCVSRALNDFRSQANLARLNMPQKLAEVAHLAAVAELLSLRRPDLLQEKLPQEKVAPEPDMEPDLEMAG